MPVPFSVLIIRGDAFDLKQTRRVRQSRLLIWSARTTPVKVPGKGRATSKG